MIPCSQLAGLCNTPSIGNEIYCGMTSKIMMFLYGFFIAYAIFKRKSEPHREVAGGRPR